MPEITRLEIDEQDAEQLREVLAEWIAKMQAAHEEMARDLVEIEQYRAETRAVIARLANKESMAGSVEA